MKKTYKINNTKNNVDPEKRWIYSLVKWCYEHQEPTLHEVQLRVNGSFYNNKRYFQKYYNERAKEKAKEILETHQPEPLPEGVPKILNEIIKEAEKRLIKV